MGAMLAASSFLSSHGAVSVTASRTYVVQETTLNASETLGQNVLIYTLGSQSNKFVVAKDGLDRATKLTPVTEPGTTNVIGYYIGTNVNAKVASSDWMSKVSGLNPVYGQGEYSSSVIGYTLGDDTVKVIASSDWLSRVVEVKPIVSSDDSPSRVVGYMIGTNAYVFASDKSVEVQQVKKVTGSTTNVVGYTIGGNTNNVFMSEDGVRQVIPNYPAVSNAIMKSAGRIFDGTNIVDASRNVYEVKHNSWVMYKYMNYEPKVPYELYYQGDVSYSNMTSKATGLIKDFYVSNRRIARSVTINGENVAGDIFIGVEGSTTNVVLTHERRSDGVYPIVWSYDSSVSNGVVYAFNGGGTQCDIRMSSDDAIETNFVGRIALKSDIPDYSDLTNMISSASEITDGVNLIKADGGVYELGEDYWVMTNIWGESNIFVKNGEYSWISIYPGSQTNEYTGEFSRKGYVEWDENAMGYIGQEGPGWYYQNEDSWGTPWGVYPGDSTLTEFSEPGWFYMREKRPDKYVGKLALTNDFSTSNAMLVATIEATAPSPGNYQAVSNAAMNARGIMDFNVRGAPEPGNGFFIVDGEDVLTWIDTDDPQDVGWYGSIHVTTNSSGYEVVGGPSFSLDSDFTSSFEYNGEEHVIVGYTDDIAFKRDIRVSKISDGTNTICASRHVFGDTNWVVNPSFYIGDSPWYYGQTITIVETGVEGEWWRPVCIGDFIGIGKGSKDSTVLTWSPDEAYIGITARRGSSTPYVGMLALTNDIPISKVGENSYEIYGSIAQGTNATASGAFSHAEGDRTLSSGKASHAEGVATRATGEASHASGVNVYATQRATFGAGVSVNGTNSASFIWSGQETSPWYGTHGKGTFNIDPIGGLNGMWIGNQTFQQAILSQLADTSRTNTVTRIIDGSGGESTVTDEIPTIRTGVEAVIGSVMDERGIPTGNTITQVVQTVVSVTSRYMWDEGDKCLYRWDMDYGFTYLTPVTNVNALLPENAHILKYLEEHKEEEQ